MGVADGVGTVTIDRPGKRNAMSEEMWRDLAGVLDRLEPDPAVRVLVLTGAGGTFCAGADIGDVGRFPGGELTAAAEERLAGFAKPTVARIEGFCVGGGCQLAAACDLRFAADDARFGITPAKLGLVYPAVTTERLVGLVGPAAAKYLLFSADLIDAGHALRIGLVDEVVPAVRLGDRVAEFCRTVSSRSQLSVQGAKDLVEAIAAGRLSDAQVDYWRGQVVESGELAEGVRAFQERRPPEFTWSGRP